MQKVAKTRYVHDYTYPDSYNYPINFTDLTGMSGESPDPPGNVRILIEFPNTSDGQNALNTRKREIEKFYPNDKIIHLEIDDLGKMKDIVESELKKAKEEGYGKTVELSTWSHGGVDVPIAPLPTSGPHALDVKQMDIEGRKDINWNFDENGSVASFYGCNTVSFAEKFLNATNVKYSGGLDGYSGGFYEHGIEGELGNANPAWLPFKWNDVYFHSWDDKTGEVFSNVYYKRGSYYTNKYGTFPKPIYLRANGSINNKGILTKGGVVGN